MQSLTEIHIWGSWKSPAEGKKELEETEGPRTTQKHGTQNQLTGTQFALQRSGNLYESVLGPLPIGYDCVAQCSYGILNCGSKDCSTLLPALGTFFFLLGCFVQPSC